MPPTGDTPPNESASEREARSRREVLYELALLEQQVAGLIDGTANYGTLTQLQSVVESFATVADDNQYLVGNS